MKRLLLPFGLTSVLLLPAVTLVAQDYDEDDPVPYDERDRDFHETGRNFGTEFYPHPRDRSTGERADNPRRYDNRAPVRRYRNARTARNGRSYADYDAYRRGSMPAVRYNDPDPFDNPYGRPRGPHYIAPDELNFRGGRYATDYPGFRGGWYGRGHRIRIRAGEYTAGDYANAFWEHQHRARAYPGEHTWDFYTGQAHSHP